MEGTHLMFIKHLWWIILRLKLHWHQCHNNHVGDLCPSTWRQRKHAFDKHFLWIHHIKAKEKKSKLVVLLVISQICMALKSGTVIFYWVHLFANINLTYPLWACAEGMFTLPILRGALLSNQQRCTYNKNRLFPRCLSSQLLGNMSRKVLSLSCLTGGFPTGCL